MNPEAMLPHGLALRAFFEGDEEAQLIIRRDDGLAQPVPVSHFFRPQAEFSPIERAALERCRGKVLDIGAGSGLHSLVLQGEGTTVMAIDISREAVEIMAKLGVREVLAADVLQFDRGPFDTLLMLGHGIGMVEDLPGLVSFLRHARDLAVEGGQLLLDSLDVRQTADPDHVAYLEANRRAGRYLGEIRLQFEFGGTAGPFCGWLHVDPDTLADRAERVGWDCQTVVVEDSGDYLARLTRRS
jgi:SAM-dependent methyltransferase